MIFERLFDSFRRGGWWVRSSLSGGGGGSFRQMESGFVRRIVAEGVGFVHPFLVAAPGFALQKAALGRHGREWSA
jgi:hypothetical protein